jgi:hypothetical protein
MELLKKKLSSISKMVSSGLIVRDERLEEPVIVNN